MSAATMEQARTETPTPCPTVQRATVDGREVVLVDDVFSEGTIEEIYRILSGGFVYFRGQLSAPEDEHPKLVAHLVDLEEVRRLSFYDRLEALLDEHHPGETLRLRKAYINQTAFGDLNYPHVDALPGREDVTLLLYANPRWERAWGGATVLYDGERGLDLAVQPRPGRVLMFRGTTWHCAGIPTRACTQSRFTLALKYEAAPTQ